MIYLGLTTDLQPVILSIKSLKVEICLFIHVKVYFSVHLINGSLYLFVSSCTRERERERERERL